VSSTTTATVRHSALARWAAAVVTALALYLVVGHAGHRPIDGETTLHGLGICLVLATVVVAVVVRPPRPLDLAPVSGLRPQPVLHADAAKPDGRARASPAWLSRFLN
jgi:hypothetical protein